MEERFGILKKAGEIYAQIASGYAQPIEGGPRLVDQGVIVEILARTRDYDHWRAW